MRRRLIPAIYLLLFLAVAGTTHGHDVILIDYSGSMAGFVRTHALVTAARTIKETTGQDSIIRFCISRPGRRTELLQLADLGAQFGSETRLYEWLRMAILDGGAPFRDAARVWFLTDNQPSSPEENVDLDRVYEWLRTPSGAPWALSVFILRLPFDGPLYGRDGHTRITPRYQGPRAAVLYVAELGVPPISPEDRAARSKGFRRRTDAVEAAFENSGEMSVYQLPVKPLDVGTVSMKLVDESAGAGPCSEHPPQPGTERLTVRPDGILVGKAMEGKAFNGEFAVELGSLESRVIFNSVDPILELGVLESADFDEKRIEASPEEGSVTLGGEEHRSACVRGKIRIVAPSLGGPRFRAAWKAFSRGNTPGNVKGTIALKIKVDRDKIVVEPRDVKEYSAGEKIWTDFSETIQKKVYRLNELFQKLQVPDGIEVIPAQTGKNRNGKPGEIPILLEVSYSPRWALVLLAPMILLGLLVAAGIFLAGILGRRRYRVLLGDEDLGVLRGFSSKTLATKAGQVGRIRCLGLGCLLKMYTRWEADGRRRRWFGLSGGSALLRPSRGEAAIRLAVRHDRRHGRPEARKTYDPEALL